MTSKPSEKAGQPAGKMKPLSHEPEARFAFECPRTWDSLAPTHDKQVRHCEDCNKPVHLSRDVRAAEANSREGRCVALTMPDPPRRGLLRRIWDAVIAAFRVLSHGRSPLPLEAIPDAPPLPPTPQVTRMGMFLVGNEDGPPNVGWLVPLDGPRRGETLLLRDDKSIVGSDEAAAVRIDGDGIAPQHCRIQKSPLGFILVDAGSPTGTRVGGKRVDTHDLIDGDQIAIGQTRLTFKTTL